jgi:hypothetical protein
MLIRLGREAPHSARLAPADRVTTPNSARLAPAVRAGLAFIASDDGRFINGNDFVMDGGMTAR